MRKISTYQKIKEALKVTIFSNNKLFVVSLLNKLYNLFKIYQIVEKQLKNIIINFLLVNNLQIILILSKFKDNNKYTISNNSI